MQKLLPYKVNHIFCSLRFMVSKSKNHESSFLEMVENYFDKAGRHTKIKSDLLNFYKKPDNLVKLTLNLKRGIYFVYCR